MSLLLLSSETVSVFMQWCVCCGSDALLWPVLEPRGGHSAGAGLWRRPDARHTDVGPALRHLTSQSAGEPHKVDVSQYCAISTKNLFIFCAVLSSLQWQKWHFSLRRDMCHLKLISRSVFTFYKGIVLTLLDLWIILLCKILKFNQLIRTRH